MGFTIALLFWGVVFIEEVDRISLEEWKTSGIKKAVSFRNTRRRPAFLLALFVGALFAVVQARMYLDGYGRFSGFEAIQMFAVAVVVFMGFIYVVKKKSNY
jgi:hypothetical protein